MGQRIEFTVVPPEGAQAWLIGESLRKSAETLGCTVEQLHIRDDNPGDKSDGDAQDE